MMQDGQTATNPQTGEKVVLRGGQWVPLGQGAPQSGAPSFVPGIKQTDPLEVERLRLSERSSDRADAASERAAAASERLATAQERQLSNEVFNQAGKLRDDYNQDPTIKAFTRALPPYIASLRGDNSPAADLALTYAFATMMDPQSAVREGEQQMQAGGDTLYGRTVARLQKELGNGGTFRPEYRRELLQQLRVRGAALRNVYDSVRRDYESRAQRGGIDPRDVLPADPAGQYGTQELELWAKQGDQDAAAELRKRDGTELRFNDEARPETGYRFTGDQEAQIMQAITDGDRGQVVALMQRFSGNNAPPSAEQLKSIDTAITNAKAGGKVAINYGMLDRQAQENADRERYGSFLDQALKERKDSSIDATVRGIADTASFGLADELSAAATTLFGGGTMKENLQRERAIDEADRRVNFGPRITGQLTGGVLNPLGRGATTAGEFARAGALGGAAYGFGSGDTLASRSLNAFLGAGGGALVGYGVAKGTSALGDAASAIANSPARLAAREARAAEMANAQNVAGAAEAEGVRVSRGILDPDARNKVTFLETTRGGGNTIHEGMTATANDLEQGVARLGAGGTALTTEGAGGAIQGAGRRFIEQTGKRADRMYQRARTLSGDAKVTPAGAISELDQNIAALAETPDTNAPLINYLEGLKRDLSREGGISIDALRSLRTNMRGQIDERNLTSTPAERIVSTVLGKASDDIATALEGRGGAAEAFRAADRFYAERMTYIDDVVRNILGNNRNPLSAEKAFGRLSAMSRNSGDGRRLAEIMRSASPEEARDIAATFANSLGRDTAGDFSPTLFVSQVEKLSPSARQTIFGKDGAKSIENLSSIAKEWRATSNNLNRSRTGVARNYRSWLGSTLGLIGGAAGFMGGGAGTAAMTGLAVKAATDGGQALADRLSAKALMSPEITKWLASAPRSSEPAAINAHIRKLGSIAARHPQLASEISAIEQTLVSAIRQLPQGAAAQGQRPTAANPNAGQNQ